MDSNIDQEWEAQLAEYTLGVMPPDIAVQFEQGLNDCRAHVVLADQFTQVVGTLGLTVPAADPPEGHKARFQAKLQATPQQSIAAVAIATEAARLSAMPAAPGPASQAAQAGQVAGTTTPAQSDGKVTDLEAYREKRSNRGLLLAVAGVAAVLVLMLGAWGLSTQNSLSTAQAEQQQTEQALARAQGALQQIAGSSDVFILKGQAPDAPNAAAVASVVTGTNEVHLWATGLKPLPSDQVYEAWWLPAQAGVSPVPAGVFPAESGGTAVHNATAPDSLDKYVGVAVTVEPGPQGVQKATGPIVLAGVWSLH